MSKIDALENVSEKDLDLYKKLWIIKKENPECKMFGGWLWYWNDEKVESFDKDKCGKWMIYSSDIFFLNNLCKEAVKRGIVWEAKAACFPRGVAFVSCFYLHIDDIEKHKDIIKFFIDNDAIDKTKSGKYRNIAFKLDSQTRNNEYGSGFCAKLNLDSFLDLKTGEFLNSENIDLLLTTDGSSSNKAKKTSDYIGREKVMKNGKRAKVISYSTKWDISVELDDGKIVEHKTIWDFNSGNIE